MTASIHLRTLRLALLLDIAVILLFMVIRVCGYRPLLAIPGALRYIVQPALLLFAYALIVSRATTVRDTTVQTALEIGTAFGLLSGMISIAHIVQENYLQLDGRSTALATWAFILAMFLPWGVAGYRAVRNTSAIGPGVLAGSWSALVCMLITVTFGFGQLLWSLSHLEQRDGSSPDFIRSGWTDLRAFAIVDIFDAGFWHLLIGPVAGAVLGGLGGAIVRILPKTMD